MKRLFGTIFTITLLCMVYGRAVYQEGSLLNPIKYCNVGPLAAVNLSMYCFQAMKDAAQNIHVLETHTNIVKEPTQLRALLKSYHKTPQRLQTMKNKLCKTMGFDPKEVQLKLNKEKDYAYSDSILKLISVGKDFLRRPAEQQLGVLAHELGHIKHNDGAAQLNFEIASSYATAVGAYFVTYALHIPHVTDIQQPVVQLVQAAYSRAQERRADYEAAQVPGAAQGLSEYLEEHKEKQGDSYTASSTHPTYAERIELLKPYVQQEK